MPMRSGALSRKRHRISSRISSIGRLKMNSLSSRHQLDDAPLPPADDGIPNFERFYLLVRRQLPLMVICGAAGMALGLVYLALSEPRYDARALMLIERGAPTDGPESAAIDNAQLQNQLEIIRSKEMAAAVLNDLGGPGEILGAPEDKRGAEDFLRDNMSVTRVDASYIFVLNFNDTDPSKAARIANAYVEAFAARLAGAIDGAAAKRRDALDQRIEQLKAAVAERQNELLEAARSAGDFDETVRRRSEIEQLLEIDRRAYGEALTARGEAENNTDPNLLRATVLSGAAPPEVSGGPEPFMIVTLGMFLGLAVGGVLGLARENADDTLRTAEDIRVALGQPLLGYLPRLPKAVHAGAAWSFAAEHPLSRYAETLRFVRARAEGRVGRGGAVVIGLCSAQAGEGKTQVCANFARLLAAEGARVLVIDADLRAAASSAAFPEHAPVSLSGLLDDPRGAALMSAEDGVAFMPARGPGDALRALYIDAEAFDRIVEANRTAFDFILIDLPALETAAYTRRLLAGLDCWVAVARWGMTSRLALHAVLRDEAGLRRNLLGLVLSDVDMAGLRKYTSLRSAAFDV